MIRPLMSIAAERGLLAQEPHIHQERRGCGYPYRVPEVGLAVLHHYNGDWDSSEKMFSFLFSLCLSLVDCKRLVLVLRIETRSAPWLRSWLFLPSEKPAWGFAILTPPSGHCELPCGGGKFFSTELLTGFRGKRGFPTAPFWRVACRSCV